MAEKGSSPPAKTVFTREATGLVRSLSAHDLLVFNTGVTGLGIAYFIMYFFANPISYPGTDYTIAFLITVSLTMLQVFSYYMFSAAMPRSGGDYVYITRTFVPPLGFALNFSLAIWLLFFVAISASLYFGPAGLGPLIIATTGNLSIPFWFTTLTGEFVMGTLMIVFFGSLMLFGMKPIFRVQTVMFYLGFIGVILLVAVMLASNNSQFIHQFNAFSAKFTGVSDTYNSIISWAKSSSFTLNPPFSIQSTIAISGWLFGFTVGYSVMSGAVGGEVKKPSWSQLVGMPGSLILVLVANVVLINLTQDIFGRGFFNAYVAAYANNPKILPLPTIPYFPLYLSLLTNNVVIRVFMLLGMAMWAVFWVPTLLVFAARSIFAWSIDRLLPDKMSFVSDRYSTPVFSVIVSIIVAEIFLILLLTIPQLAFLVGIAGTMPTFIAVGVAAIIFPFRKRDIFALSPVKWKIGKIPVMSLVGLGAAIWLSFIMYQYMTDPLMGANTPVGIGFLLAVITLGLVIYFAMTAYRRHQGINIEQAYKELPIE